MRTHLLLPCRCFVLLFGVLLTPAAVLAQGQLGDWDSLSKAYDQNEARRKDLFKGDVGAAGAGDKKIAEASARWFIYRISHTSVLIDQAKLARVHKEFNDIVKNVLMEPKAQATNRAFVNMFGVALVQSMKDVLEQNASGRPQAYVHACMMLPTMAKLKQGDVGDYLVSLMSDPKGSDVARLHAVKALREYLPVDSLDANGNYDLADKNVIAKKARDVKYVDALVKYVETPVKVDGMSSEEAAAVNYLRREAIITLASTEAPAVATLKKVGKIEGGVAPTLMRVCAGNLEPAPMLQEKIEAAIGLCKMRYWNPNFSSKIKNAHQDEYQAELAAYLVGKTLDEFIGAYKADFENFTAKGAARRLPRTAFRLEAKRLDAALTEIANYSEGAPAAGNAQKLKKEAAPVLTSISKHENLNNDLIFRNKVVPSLRPKTGYVFKSLKTAEITLPPQP
jgi:hypothetical protein